MDHAERLGKSCSIRQNMLRDDLFSSNRATNLKSCVPVVLVPWTVRVVGVDQLVRVSQEVELTGHTDKLVTGPVVVP